MTLKTTKDFLFEIRKKTLMKRMLLYPFVIERHYQTLYAIRHDACTTHQSNPKEIIVIGVKYLLVLL